MILFYFKLGSSLLGSTFVFTCHFGTKTILSRSHFEDNSSPHISGFGSLIRINLTFVLFKLVILMWINYLETWLRSDNTSCYYIKVALYFLCNSQMAQQARVFVPGRHLWSSLMFSGKARSLPCFTKLSPGIRNARQGQTLLFWLIHKFRRK